MPDSLPEINSARGSFHAVWLARCTHSPSSNDHELIKLQHPSDFKIRNSDDLHVKILLLEFEMMGKCCD